MARRLKVAFRCLLSAALIIFVARKVDWRHLGLILGRVDVPSLLGASLLTGLLIVGLALRWRIFLEQQNIVLPFGTVLGLTWAGQFFNSLLPGSTGGDVFKIYQVCRLAHDRKATAAATVLADRLSASLALLLFAAIAVAIYPGPAPGFAEGLLNRVSWRWALGGVILLGAAGWALFRRLKPSALFARLVRLVRAVVTNFVPNGKLALALCLAFGIHLLNFFIIYVFARSLGAEISYGKMLLVMPVVLLLVMLPVTVNGHGLREVLLIGYFTEMQIRITGRADVAYQEIAVALSVLIVANDLVWSLPGGIRYLTRFRGGRERDLAVALEKNR